MPRKVGDAAKMTTRLAVWRVHRGVSQRALAQAIGISLTAYRDMELGRSERPPPLGYLLNAAKLLGCRVWDLVERDTAIWTVYDAAGAPAPLAPEDLWTRFEDGPPPGLNEDQPD